MALIKCPECGKDISNRTEKCVHCGYPVKQFILQKKKKKIRIEISCIIFFFIVIIISGCCYVLYLNDWDFDGSSNAIIHVLWGMNGKMRRVQRQRNV